MAALARTAVLPKAMKACFPPNCDATAAVCNDRFTSRGLELDQLGWQDNPGRDGAVRHGGEFLGDRVHDGGGRMRLEAHGIDQEPAAFAVNL
jgi:hypothetical protein